MPAMARQLRRVCVTLVSPRRDARETSHSIQRTPDPDTVNQRHACFLLLILSLSLLFAACGQKGDLYRPVPSSGQSTDER